MSGFWKDVASSVTQGLAGSDNPYIAAAGGLFGGGGGSGPTIVASPPPPPPPPPMVGPVGNVAPSMPLGVGVAVVGGLVLVLLLAKRK